MGAGRLILLRLGHQGAGGANGGAGTAVLTGEIGRISTAEKGDGRVESPSGKGQKVVAISATANGDALATEHAAEWIVDEDSEVNFFVHVSLEEFQRVRFQADLEMFGDADQLATTFDRTDLRVAVVGGHEQFEAHTLETSHRWGGGPYYQTLTDFLGA